MAGRMIFMFAPSRLLSIVRGCRQKFTTQMCLRIGIEVPARPEIRCEGPTVFYAFKPHSFADFADFTNCPGTQVPGLRDGLNTAPAGEHPDYFSADDIPNISRGGNRYATVLMCECFWPGQWGGVVGRAPPRNCLGTWGGRRCLPSKHDPDRSSTSVTSTFTMCCCITCCVTPIARCTVPLLPCRADLSDVEEGGETTFPRIPAPGGDNGPGFSECAR